MTDEYDARDGSAPEYAEEPAAGEGTPEREPPVHGGGSSADGVIALDDEPESPGGAAPREGESARGGEIVLESEEGAGANPAEEARGEGGSDGTASPADDGEEPEHPPIACCRFIVAGMAFHVPTEALVEIVEKVRVTPVPLSPGYVVGVVSVRGEVVPVVDLGTVRGVSSDWAGERRLVITEAGGEKIAFIADGMPDLAYELGGEAVDVREFLNRYRVVMH